MALLVSYSEKQEPVTSPPIMNNVTITQGIQRIKHIVKPIMPITLTIYLKNKRIGIHKDIE
jgi:hypothetical protein